MRERCFSILKLLREADGYVTADTLAESLQVCPRSIRNDISELKHELGQLGIDGLSSKTHNGYRLELTAAQWKQVDTAFFSDQPEQAFSSFAGGQYAVLEMLLKNGGAHLRQLKQSTYSTGRETAEYINAARQWLRGYNILLHRRKGQGFSIDGAQHWVRLAQWGLYRDVMHASGTTMDNDSICRFFKISHNYNLSALPARLEQKYDLCLSSESYVRIVFLLTAVLVDHRRKNPYHFPMDPIPVSKMDRDMSLDCVRWMQEMCSIRLAAEERDFFTFLIASSEILEFSTEQRQLEFEGEHRPLQKLVKSTATIVGSVLQYDLTADPELLRGWMYYLKAIDAESHYGVLGHPRGPSAPSEDVEIRLACWSASHLLEQSLGILVTEQVISCLARHVKAAIERNGRSVNAILVSDETPGAIRLLQAKIQKAFPNMTITQICHSHYAQKLVRSLGPGLVISTKELPNLAKQVLTVISPAFTQADVAQIQSRIRRYCREQVTVKPMTVSAQPIFREELVLFLSGEETKNEILQRMVAALTQCGAVDSMFLESVYRREKSSSTYLDQGIAIPHGFPEFVQQPMVAVAFLQKPVRWSGSEWADVVFLLAVNMDPRFEARKDIIPFYRGLTQTLSKPEELQNFKHLTSAAAVVDAIKAMMTVNTPLRKE